MSRPQVLIWRTQLLPGSETFIRDQTDAYCRYRPVVAGALAVDSPLARESDHIMYTRSLWDRAALWAAELTGIAPRVTGWLRRHPNITVVHAHFGKDAWLVARAARRVGLPLVITCHGYDVTALPRTAGVRGWWHRARLRRLFRRASVIAVSQFIADEARRWGARQVEVIYTGVAETAQRPPVRSAGSSPVCDVLFIGRLVAKKGVDDLLTAVGLLLGDGENDSDKGAARSLSSGKGTIRADGALISTTHPLRVQIVGDGPLKPEVLAQIRSLQHRYGRRVSIQYRGALPPDETRQLLTECAVFVAPSRTAPNGDSEGFGQVFLEAAFAGKPAIGTHHGGISEAIVDEQTGLLVPAHNPEALAAAMRRLLADPQLRARLGSAAARRVRDELTITAGVAAVEDHYDRRRGFR